MLSCSFGIIPFRVDADAIRFLLVWEPLHEGHWNFPKGRAKDGESPLQTALRELKEETGLAPKAIVSPETDPLVQEYSFEDKRKGCMVDRRLEYFVALMGNDEVDLAFDEVTEFKWMTLDELLDATPFPELQKMARDAYLLAINL